MFNGFNGSLEHGQFFASLLQILGGPQDQQNLDELIAAFTGSPVNSIKGVGGANTPLLYVAQSGPDLVVLIGPAPSVVAATQFFAGYTRPSNLDSPNVINQWANDQAAYFASQITGSHFSFGQRTTYAGHSAGGAIAECMAYAQITAGVGAQPFIYTFGSPRAGGSNMRRAIGTGFQVRYMNDSDPIPTLPPRFEDNRLVCFLAGASQVLSWGNFEHSAGGLQLDNMGNQIPTVLPQHFSPIPGLDVAGWMIDALTDTVNPHNIAEYKRRLTLAIATDPGGGGDIPPDAPFEVMQPITPVEAHQQVAAAQQTIFAQASAQVANPVEVPELNLFAAVRSGRIWIVTFNGVQIAVGPTRKRARALARTGNAYLREQQIMGVVDPLSILQGLAEYFDAATSPTGGFTPVMATTLPT